MSFLCSLTSLQPFHILAPLTSTPNMGAPGSFKTLVTNKTTIHGNNLGDHILNTGTLHWLTSWHQNHILHLPL